MNQREELTTLLNRTRHVRALHLEVPAEIITSVVDGIVEAVLSDGWVKPEYEWATQYPTEPEPIRAISEASAREMAAISKSVALLKRPAAGEWTVTE
jgi:hypothetical protein